MADDLIDRLREFARETVATVTADNGEQLTYEDSVIWLAADALASKDKALEEMRAELERARQRNRKLHRRAQIAEAVNQSTEGTLAIWTKVLENRYSPENQKWLLFSLALDDIAKQRKRIAARAQADGETP